MMPSRYEQLQRAYHGLLETGIPLLSFDGSRFGPVGSSDDLGIYVIIPMLAQITGLSVDQSIQLFFMASIGFSFAFSSIGVLMLYGKWKNTVIGLLVVLYYYYVLYRSFYGDVYIFYSLTPLAVVPLFLYFSLYRRDHSFLILAVFAGVSLGISNSIRSYSGVGALLFALLVLAVIKEKATKKAMIALALIIGSLVPNLAFDALIYQRDNYLAENTTEYQPVSRGHPLWHSIYIGLGYLDNHYGIKYQDEAAIEKVKFTSPEVKYLSEEYEQILRQEVVSLIIHDPIFVGATVLAKTYEILSDVVRNYFLFLVVFALYAYLSRAGSNGLGMSVAFVGGAVFSIIFGILVMPMKKYTNGVFAFVILYFLYTLVYFDKYGLNVQLQARFDRIKNRMFR